METPKKTFFKQLPQMDKNAFLTKGNRVGLNDDGKILLKHSGRCCLAFFTVFRHQYDFHYFEKS